MGIRIQKIAFGEAVIFGSKIKQGKFVFSRMKCAAGTPYESVQQPS
jgi:hypothetical protein